MGLLLERSPGGDAAELAEEGVEELLWRAAQDALVEVEGHQAVGGDVGADVGRGQTHFEAGEALGGDLDVVDVAAVLDPGEGESAGGLEAGEQLLEVGAGLEEAVGEAGQGVKRGQGGLPALVDHAAVNVAQLARLSDEVLVAGEDSAVGRAEVLVERDVDGVEERCRAAEVEVWGAGKEEGAGAVPVHADIFLF